MLPSVPGDSVTEKAGEVLRSLGCGKASRVGLLAPRHAYEP